MFDAQPLLPQIKLACRLDVLSVLHSRSRMADCKGDAEPPAHLAARIEEHVHFRQLVRCNVFLSPASPSLIEGMGWKEEKA
jgi:hypothetical protein